MSIIKCPECEKSISDQAGKCPHCGFPLTANPTPIIVQQKGEGCFLQTLNIGCLLILIFGALIIASLVFSSLIFNKEKLQEIEKNKTEQKK